MMNRLPTSLALGLLATVLYVPLLTTSRADENPVAERESGVDARRAEARRVATEKRRAWLRKHLTQGQRDPVKVAQLNARLDSLDDQQVDVAAARLLEQLDERDSRKKTNQVTGELQRALEDRQARQQFSHAGRHAAAMPAPVGFFPIITVLPAGVSLTASAVVSPDGRHVRVNVNPFFSSIGPVDTFNFATGETYRLQESNRQHRRSRPVTPRYDGLRTRNDRVPRR